MPRTPADVIKEWELRGYISAEPSNNDSAKYLSYINQAKDVILSYCNIPLTASMPDGLFYPWVEISWATVNGATLVHGSGAIKAVTEGDTKVEFDVGTTVVKGAATAVDYTAVLRRFRRMP